MSNRARVIAAVAIWLPAVATAHPARRPAAIIDIHMHAAPAPPAGGPGVPRLDSIAPTMPTDAAVHDTTLAIMERSGIVLGAVSGPLRRVLAWVDGSPGRFLGGPVLGGIDVAVDSLRALYRARRLAVMGEVSPIYVGLSPADTSLDRYYALAEELDIPVGIHMQGGGAAGPGLRVAMGNPLLLEDVLVRHPRLRVNMMHAGYPFLGETIAILRNYPQVYADLAHIDWSIPTEEFHEYLRALVRAGFASRLMFGSDAGPRPHAILRAIQSIESAPFLTPAQKRGIFYDNAVRFLRLSPPPG
jgi:predicted TIM-barrel fold metal-dependent hydrolase